MIRFFLTFFIILGIDQLIKFIFIEGYRFEGECISLILVYNKGVAFSMFAFLEAYLKYIQIAILAGLFYFFYREKILQDHQIVSGALFAAGLSNIADRFMHEGVVDYVYWHCGFDFAIFNFADVMIDVSVVSLLYLHFFGKMAVNSEKKENETKG